MEDRCVICGDKIPEGRQVCPKCSGNEGTAFESLMKRKDIQFEIDDRIESAFRSGFEEGKRQVEEKHLSECRQISEYDIENKALKELLRKAIDTLDEFARGYCMCCKHCEYKTGKCTLEDKCKDKDNWEWENTAEAMQMIGGGENG